MKFDEKYNCLNGHYIHCNDNRKRCVLEETKGVKYIISNINDIEYVVLKIDNGLINTNASKQCDFAIYIPSSDTVRFIELKGSNLDDAFEQLLETINVLIAKPNISLNKLQARIVVRKAKAPAIRSLKKTKLEKIVKSFDGDLLYKSKEFTEQVN